MRKIASSGNTERATRVELPGRRQVAAEGLLDDQARVLGQAGLAQALDHRLEQRGRHREVVRRALGALERLLQRVEGLGLVVVAADVADRLLQLVERGAVVDAAAFLLDRVAHALVHLVVGLRAAGDADHTRHQLAALGHRVQRGEDLLVGEVAREAEQHEGVGVGGVARWSCRRSWQASGFLLRVPAELGAHRGQDLVGERGLAARREAVVQRGAEHLRGHAFVDGGLDRPAALAGVGHAAAERRQLRVGDAAPWR